MTHHKLFANLPDSRRENNNKGILVTKHALAQCMWGEHTESDGLQNLQQAILTAYSLTHTHVTQYTTNLTSAIYKDSSVWQHTVRNACNDHILPHPLHNPITIFNIHHNSHFTTLIADPYTYSYYDPLNLHPPQHTQSTHTTLKQRYADPAIAPPLLSTTAPTITIKSTPQQTDN